MRKQRRGMTILQLLVAIAVLAVLLGFLLREPTSTRCDRTPQRICENHLLEITLALDQYAERYGCYPPAYVTDASGRPAHSWRMLIMPYIDQQGLYNAYNFGQPWDGPDNSKLLDFTPSQYACPVAGLAPGYTSYLALVGPKSLFPGSGSVAKADVRDGLDKTLMLAESNSIAVPWTAPRDLDIERMSLTINDQKHPGIGGNHPDGASVAFADGSIRRLPPTTRPDALRAMLTINGGEAIELPKSP